MRFLRSARFWKFAVLAWLLAACAALATLYFHRPGMEQYAVHRFTTPPAAGRLSLTWLGVTAVLLSDGEHALMIDPFFTRPPGLLGMVLNREIAPDEVLIREWLEKLKVERLDAVLVSHSHFDHAMDAGVVARLTGAQLVGSVSTANIGRGAGLSEDRIHIVQDSHPVAYGSFRVRFIESRHAGATGGKPTGNIDVPLLPPARYLDYRLGGAYSILVEHAQGSVLHHGSAGFVPGALRGQKADVVLLGVALIDDLDAYLREVVDAVGARHVVPTHWDDFTRPLDQNLRPFPIAVDLPGFFSGLALLRPDIQVHTLEAGRAVTLPGRQ